MSERVKRSLHNEIMNLQIGGIDPAHQRFDAEPNKSYRVGHRDALHAAAEMAAEHEAIESALVEALQGLVAWTDGPRKDALNDLSKAREALKLAYGETQ